jgi:hypothetical protein
VVAIRNSRAGRNAKPLFYPTIGAAIAAERPWLSVLCPACRRVGNVDLRRLDRHPGAPISSLIPALSCWSCCPNPPFAQLLGLSADRWQVARRRKR